MARDKQMKPHAIHVHTNRVHAPLLTMNEWEESKSSKWTIEQVTTLRTQTTFPLRQQIFQIIIYLFQRHILETMKSNNEIAICEHKRKWQTKSYISLKLTHLGFLPNATSALHQHQKLWQHHPLMLIIRAKLITHSPQHSKVQQQSHFPQYFVLYTGKNGKKNIHCPLHMMCVLAGFCIIFVLFSLLCSISPSYCKITWLKIVCQMIPLLWNAQAN